MSQGQGYIGEAELPGLIWNHLGLKLGKEAFLKPNQAVVIEIYSAFLDKTYTPWRKNINPDLGTPAPNIFHFLKKIISRYNIEYEFKLDDILEPERKRTTVFINVMLLFLAQWEERVAKLSQWKAELQEKQEDNLRAKERLRYLKQERERLALEIGQSVSLEEAERQKKAADERFQVELAKSKQLEARKDSLKVRLDELKSQDAKKTELLQTIQEQIREKETILEKANKCALLEQELNRKKQTLEEKKLTAGIRENQLRAALEKKRSETEELKREVEAEKEHDLMELSKLDKKISEIKDRKRRTAELTKSHEERAKKKLEAIEIKAKESMEISRKGYAALNDYNHKLNQLIGTNKPATNDEQSDVSVNRTFIKSAKV